MSSYLYFRVILHIWKIIAYVGFVYHIVKQDPHNLISRVLSVHVFIYICVCV